MPTHNAHKHRLAVFPGTFDPLTNGHLDIIQRGAAMFDEVLVALGDNDEKAPFFDNATRLEIVRQAVAKLPNVSVEAYKGLTLDLVRRRKAAVILRGIRGNSDLGHEMQLATTNRVVAGVETVFILADPAQAVTSSSLVRQLIRLGGDVSGLVPGATLKAVRQYNKKRRQGRGT